MTYPIFNHLEESSRLKIALININHHYYIIGMQKYRVREVSR